MRTQLLQSLFLILFLPFMMVSQDCFEDILPNGGDCNSAIFLCGNLFDGYTGTLPSTPTDTSVGTHPDVLCVGGDVDNIQWYSFIPCESSIELDIIPSSCMATSTIISQFGLQTGIYEDCTFGNPLFCYAEQGVVTVNIVLNDLVPGNIYYLFVDGYAGSVCDYSFDVISGIDTSEPEQPDDVNVDITASSTSVCEGEQIKTTFAVPDLNIGGFSCGDITGEDLNYVACFEWEVTGTPEDGTVALEDAYDIVRGGNTACADIIFYEKGNYQVTTNAQFNPAVFDGAGSCTVANVNFAPINIEVLSQEIKVLPEVVLCDGEEFMFCDTTYMTSQVAQCIENCTTFVQSIVFTPSTLTELGPFFVCSGECFEYGGIDYCSLTSYTIGNSTDCDNSIFEIQELVSTIDYGGDDEINCDVESITLNPVYTINNNAPLHYQWTDQSNTDLGNGATLEINREGIYTVVVTADDIAIGCPLSHTIEITESSNLPNLAIDPPILTCDDNTGVLSVSSNLAVQSVSWTGPSFTSNELSPTIDEAGLYTIALTAINGCTTIEDVNVTADIIEPTIDVDYRDIDCNVIVVNASYTSDVAIRSQVWSGPGISSDDMSILITEAGNYSLTVTGFNGCETTETFIVNNIIDWPVVDAGPDLLWNCNTETLPIIATIPSGAEYQYQWNLLSGDPFVAISDDRIEAKSIGSYEIVVTNVNLGCVSRDTVIITENLDVPSAFVGEVADPMCFTEDNGYIMIEGVTGGTAPYALTIDNNPVLISEMLGDLADGTYDLSITDGNGCNYTEELTLSKPVEIVLNAPTEVGIKYYANGSIVVDYSIDEADVAVINWYDARDELIGEGESIEFNEKTNTFYTVELITVDGCIVSQEIEIRVDTSVDIYVPNIFSPNGDGSNDIFWIHGEDNDIMIESLVIYDRWGSQVYETENMPVGESSRGWDGKFNGQDVNPGVFVYLIEIRTSADEVIIKTGDITVVR